MHRIIGRGLSLIYLGFTVWAAFLGLQHWLGTAWAIGLLLLLWILRSRFLTAFAAAYGAVVAALALGRQQD